MTINHSTSALVIYAGLGRLPGRANSALGQGVRGCYAMVTVVDIVVVS